MNRDNELLMRRVAEAMRCGHYPSPSDAKVVDDQLRKAHAIKRRRQLEVHYHPVSWTANGPCPVMVDLVITFGH